MRTRHKWSDDETLLLQSLYNKVPNIEIANKLGLTVNQIKDRATTLGLKVFTTEQFLFLKGHKNESVEFFIGNPLFATIPKNKIVARLVKLNSVKWTTLEIELLKSLLINDAITDVKQSFTQFTNKTALEIESKIYTLRKYNNNRKWKPSEIDYVLKNYDIVSKEILAKTLNCSTKQIYGVYRNNK